MTMPIPSSRKVLVIDDDPLIRQFIVEHLRDVGYEVTEARDGESGLALLDGFEPDLLIIDIRLPGMHGGEVGKRARERLPKAPIVFISGYSDRVEEAAALGALILRKPFLSFDLQSALNDAQRQRL
jgi:CheY-like chemotaxis protein